ncbi:hypothetical protein RR48_12264 [Papilio machaon]|uniref:Uncharacterized protein n=1 Tax=Papilio machaon TaxID=76193 RepID=A0A194QY58_PAPMA|nr:hypothetical protein RR48_12264 [Papilio machaon]
MVQCKKCKQFVSTSKEDVLKCKGECKGVFHKKCVKNNTQFLQNEMCDLCMADCVSESECDKTSGSSAVKNQEKSLRFLKPSAQTPHGASGATEGNIEEYMDKLHALVTENKNNPIVKQARDILTRVDLPMT